MEHHFNIYIASEYGLVEAILLNRLWFWIEKNKTEGVNYHDGRYWTYNSARAIAELFPYLSTKQVRTSLKKLVDKGILVTGRYNKQAYDRTLWYAFTEKGEAVMFGNIDFPKRENDNCPNGKMSCDQMGKPIPVTTTVTTTVTTNNIYAQEFEELWEYYPRKLGKKKAMAAYCKARKEGTSFETIRDGLEAYVNYIGARGIEEQFIKHGATWFNQKAWEDDYDTGRSYSERGSLRGDIRQREEEIRDDEESEYGGIPMAVGFYWDEGCGDHA